MKQQIFKNAQKPAITNKSTRLVRPQKGLNHHSRALCRQALKDNYTLFSNRANTIQPKLAISQPGDKCEHEADRVAEAVMRMPAPASVGVRPEGAVEVGSIQRMCSRCQRRFREGKFMNCKQCEEELQRKKIPEESPAVNAQKQQQIQSLSSDGRPLPKSLRSFFEPRFRRDFGSVRIHTDKRADEIARSVNAEAFTLGQDVVFQSKAYRPSTPEGRKLLAHELTHVMQQNDTPSLIGSIQRRVSTRSTNCPANTNNAPSDPIATLQSINNKAGSYARGTARLLDFSALLVEAGDTGFVDSEYERAFGLPPASGDGFMNRLTGEVRPSREAALSEEMKIFSRRFELIADYLNQSIAYRCDAPLTWGGCNFSACDTNDNAGACSGTGAIKICPHFWDHGEDAQAGILIHEVTHIYWARATHNASSNLRLSQCYEELVAQIYGFNAQSQTCPTP